MEGQLWRAADEAPASWSIYFAHEAYMKDDRRVKLITELAEFFQSRDGQCLLSKVRLDEQIYYLPLDFQALCAACNNEDLEAALEVAPKEALSCLGAASYEAIFSRKNPEAPAGKINVRLHNQPGSSLPLKNLKAAYIGRLVSVRGTVVRMSVVKPLVTQMDFTCGKCASLVPCQFPDGKYTPPTSCIVGGCKSKSFLPNRTKIKAIDFQKIRIQELLFAEGYEEGRMPRTVECELGEDLVDACMPGDVVTVCGLVKVINTDIDVGRGRNKNQCLFYLYLEAVSVTNSKNMTENRADARAAAPPNAQHFTSRDLEFIAKFHEEHGSDIFRQILHSVCPSIYGHELVKAGITLSLFGGVQKHLLDENKVPVRGDIHIIIVIRDLAKASFYKLRRALHPVEFTYAETPLRKLV